MTRARRFSSMICPSTQVGAHRAMYSCIFRDSTCRGQGFSGVVWLARAGGRGRALGPGGRGRIGGGGHGSIPTRCD
ncbi:hypothetical protein A5N15_01815 [Rothia kristinae]|uniref:Uncharacterized protein n=1 Tax=Rothia kristinae TaxID=37923 RepID=A0A657IVV4_9MICC|nr:hypothetical protein A5N15_01815 [Rothia kristinae]